MTSTQIPAAHLDIINTGRTITIVLMFPRHLDQVALKNAFRAVLEVEPILGCRMVEEEGKAAWERREDLGALEILTVEKAAKNPDDAVKRFVTDAGPDPSLVRALLIRGGRGDTLCISISHAVTDVTGALDLLPALAALYTRYISEPDFWPVQGGYGDRGSWQLIDSAGIIETIATIPVARPPEPVFRGPVGTGEGWGKPGGDIAVQAIGPERFRAIREAADSRGATMTDVILAAFFRGLCRTLHPPEEEPLPLEVSVDMRYLLPDEDIRRIANLSGAEFPAFTWTPGEQFRTTLTRAKEQLDAFDSGYPGLPFILHASVEAEDELTPPADAFIPRLESHDLSGEEERMFADIPVSGVCLLCHGKGPVLCASVFRDTLTLAVSFPGCSSEIADAITSELDHFP